MRIFINQTNTLVTDPVINSLTKESIDDATIIVKIFDKDNILVPNSTITLGNGGSGNVYFGTMPILNDLVDKQEYFLEVDIRQSGITIWYFKGPITAIIRRSNQ